MVHLTREGLPIPKPVFMSYVHDLPNDFYSVKLFNEFISLPNHKMGVDLLNIRSPQLWVFQAGVATWPFKEAMTMRSAFLPWP